MPAARDAGGSALVVPFPPDGPATALHAALAPLLHEARGSAVVLVRVSQPAPASARLAHEVVDALLEAGCSSASVGVVCDIADTDRGHASAQGLAHAAGLTGRTGRGHAYPVCDLRADLVEAPVPTTSVLSGQRVSRLWATADLRVVLARAVTDLFDAFSGALSTLVAAVGPIPGADIADVAADVAAHLPPHVAVVDAIEIAHGPDGGRLPLILPASRVVVAADAIAADTAVAQLLGEDRSASPLLAAALRASGTPAPTPVTGDFERLPVVRVHPLLRAAARAAAADPTTRRALSAAIGGPDRTAGAVDPVLAGVRSVVSPLVASAADPAGRTVLAGVLMAVGSLAAQPQAWATNLAKGRVRRRIVPLGFDPAARHPAEYNALPESFAPFEALLARLPSEGDELRWCMVDGATVFEVSRDIAADFDAFVARVDVAEGISLMADYIGGRRVEVAVMGNGDVHQAERNIYLPQPNYLALAGGLPIDVCKIELVRRAPSEHRLFWRTISSPNGSAMSDDGILALTRTPSGTRATIRGRQQFALPPAWASMELAALPEVRDPLLEEAYRRFFTTTFDNLEACFEGRPFRIGRDVGADEPLPTAAIHQLLSMAQQHLGTANMPVSYDLDQHGFRHFSGATRA